MLLAFSQLRLSGQSKLHVGVNLSVNVFFVPMSSL